MVSMLFLFHGRTARWRRGEGLMHPITKVIRRIERKRDRERRGLVMLGECVFVFLARAVYTLA